MASVEMPLPRALASSSERSGVRSHVPLTLQPVQSLPAATCMTAGLDGIEDSPYSAKTETPRDEISPSKWSDLTAYSGKKVISFDLSANICCSILGIRTQTLSILLLFSITAFFFVKCS